MRNKLAYVIIFVWIAISITACSEDNNPMIAPQELNKDFGMTSETRFSATYSGEPLIGKTAAFHTEDSKIATITLNDIIPGESQTVIGSVQLMEAKGEYTFDGSVVSTLGASIAYSGSVNSNELHLELNVTMPEKTLMKSYTLSQLELGDESYWMYSRKGIKPPYTYTYKEMTRQNTVIKSAGYVAITHTLPGVGTTPQDTIDACTLTTFTDKFRSVLGCMLPQVLQTVSLEKDGNVTAGYSSDPVMFDQSYLINPQGVTPETITELIAGRTWKQSPKNLAYWFEKDGKIYIKLNFAAIVLESMGDSDNSKVLAAVISSVLNGDAISIKKLLNGIGDVDFVKVLASMSDETFIQLFDWLKNGIPVKVSTEGTHTYMYLDREVLDPIMAEIPLFLPYLEKLIPDESAAMAMSTINNILKGYKYTSKFEVGLDLKVK